MRRYQPLVLSLFLLGCPSDDGDKPDDTEPTGTTPAGLPTVTNPVPPRAEDDLAGVDEGGQTAVNVAANDLVTANPLALGSVTVVEPPQFGSVTTQANGTVDYVHDGSETSADSFTYFIEDNAGLASNVASVRITVAPINDPPIAVADAGVVDQWGAATFDLAANDSDADNGLDLGSISVTSQPASGTLTVGTDGTVDYTHDGSLDPTDSFRYTIADVSGATSNEVQVDVTVNSSNQPPTAGPDLIATTEGGTVVFDVTYNDSDPDDGLDLTSITVTTQPSVGTATANPDGTIEYTHNGTNVFSDVFNYTIADNSGAVSNAAQVQVLISGVNDPPIASDDAATLDEGSTTTIQVLGNDVDSDGTVDPTSVTVVSGPSLGSTVVNPDGSVDYTHDGSETLADSFTYTVLDDDGAPSNPATVDLTITPVNDPPSASNDADGVLEGGSVQIDLAANDSDADDGLDLTSITVVSGPSSGTVLINGDGTVDYDHDGSETLSDSFTYTIADASGASSNTATVDLTVTPVNDPPTTVADAFNVDEGTSGNLLDVLANDSDADDGLDPSTLAVISTPSSGTVLVNPGGWLEYDHDGSETASDSLTYSVADVGGTLSPPTTVTLTITPVNDPPVANNDADTVAEGASRTVDVLGNDTDADDGLFPPSVVLVGATVNGTAAVNPDGSITYTHDGSETLSGTFQYRVSDLSGAQSNTATVSMTVTPVNDPPVAQADNASLNQGDVGVVIPVLNNDSDVDNSLDLGSVSIVSPPSQGAAIPQPNGTVLYDHFGGPALQDSFSYTVDDVAGGTSNVATVTLNIANVDTPPIAVDDSLTGLSGSTTALDVLANDTDDFGLVPGSVVVVAPPMWGTATVLPTGEISYTNDGRQAWADRLGYEVSDTGGNVSNIAWVDIDLNPFCPFNNTYTYTGGSASFTPEDCVGSALITATGAAGEGDNPGFGGLAEGRLLLRPGDSLTITVGGQNGFNGGGVGDHDTEPRNGGGASDVRLNGNALANRVLVAAGGGAGGQTDAGNYRGGDGGGGTCGANYCGGAGGEGYGGPGGDGSNVGGTGITGNAHSGGAGGGGFTSGGAASCQTYVAPGSCGSAGTLGFGGNGDLTRLGNALCFSTYGGTRGGGGGYYGGGGTSIGFCGGGGGGGGSSYVGDLADAVMSPGVQIGNGLVDITWGPALTGLVGAFEIRDGPAWAANPPVVNCLEACALLFGGQSADYQCSTSDTVIDNQAFVDGYGDTTYCNTPVAEDFAEGYDTGYNCPNCSYSALVSDHGCSAVNYCWR